MTAITGYQADKQNQDAITNLDALDGWPVTPGQNDDIPSVLRDTGLIEKAYAAKNSLPNVNPPSEDEIRHTSWICSGLIGLLGAIVSGNAAGGIAAGMVAALAVHDQGYHLRQRAESVDELHKEGYSKRAIEAWYETGDNKELDAERQNMESIARDEFNAQESDNRQAINNKAADDRQTRSETFQEGQEGRREAFQAGQGALNREAASNAAVRAADKQAQADQRLSNSEVAKQIAPQQQKLSMLHAADADLTNLENAMHAGNKEMAEMAYNSYIEHKAKGMQGGGASMTKKEMEDMVGLPDWSDSELQKWHLLGNGTPTKTWMAAQRAGTANDLHVETKVLMDSAIQHYESLLAGGYSPEQASKMTNNSYSGTGLAGIDYSKLPPAGSVDATQAPEKPSEAQVDSVMAKYGHTKK